MNLNTINSGQLLESKRKNKKSQIIAKQNFGKYKAYMTRNHL